jgi:hypothetical protein
MIIGVLMLRALVLEQRVDSKGSNTIAGGVGHNRWCVTCNL